MDIAQVITSELGIQPRQTEAVIRLIDEGNTIPFIARYRKEMTGAMNDELLRRFDERLRSLRALEERRQTVLSTIEAQGQLTAELRARVEGAMTAVELEDIYRPYRPKRRTRAMIAKEKGLQGLADYIMSDGNISPEKEAEKYIDPEKEVPDAETALALAKDIIAEMVSDNADFRTFIRNLTMNEGMLVTAKKAVRGETSGKKAGARGGDDAEGENAGSAKAAADASAKTAKSAEVLNKKLADREQVYENYFEYEEALKRIPGHRILAINRGETEKFLTVKIAAPEEKILERLFAAFGCAKNPVMENLRREACEDAYRRLIAPSIETEIRNSLTEKAEDGALEVFDSNLEQLLMQPPVAGKTVLGWDPAFRTGCKLAVVDRTGQVLDTAVIYPTAPQNKVAEAERVLDRLIDRYHVDVISVGNGTASRESEQIIASYLKKSRKPVQYVIVNEAGASVYSASPAGTEEFPEFDVGQRSAASIARRLQDPLAELVKIDPKAIGVGQYQHDMDQARLGEKLTGVVERCVNNVGVDINTASAALLAYIAGVSKPVAKNIVAYREQNGRFKGRQELLKVPRLGPKAFEQCAGFLRIRDGKEVLDMTAVHPESYQAARAAMEYLGCSAEDIRSGKNAGLSKKLAKKDWAKLSELTGVGEYTMKDIVGELEKPGRDPREDVPGPVLRSDVLDFADLKPDMILKGTVRNVVDFGAFVDIGVHQDGLVHISQLSDRFVKHPLDVVKVGDVVTVKVLSVDEKKKKISLSMKGL